MPPTYSEKAICRLILEKFPLLLQKYPCHVASISLMSWLDFCLEINDEIQKNNLKFGWYDDQFCLPKKSIETKSYL